MNRLTTMRRQQCPICTKLFNRGRQYKRHVKSCYDWQAFLDPYRAGTAVGKPPGVAAATADLLPVATAVDESAANHTRRSSSSMSSKLLKRLSRVFSGSEKELPTAGPPTAWKCDNCTLENAPSASRCEACDFEHIEYRHGVSRSTAHLALQHAECVVCFDPLHARPCGVFVEGNEGKRSCRHILHRDCIDGLAPASGCPTCRTPFQGVLVLPDPADQPAHWFKMVDYDGDGVLSKAEVYDALRAQLPLDDIKLAALLESTLWDEWDHDKSGTISEEEFIHPTDGMLTFILRNRERLELSEDVPVPSLTEDKLGWFDYWDDDDSGELCKQEIVRALLKSFGFGTDKARVRELRQAVDAVFFLFDTDGNGTVDADEFVRADTGLCDTILANLQFLAE